MPRFTTMMRRVFSFTALAIALVLFVWSENEAAPSFRICVYQNTPNGLDSSGNYARIIEGFVEARATCSIRLVDRHAGFFTFLATIAIAWFTYSLRQSTDELWRAGERQLRAMRQSVFVSIAGAKAAKRSADIAEKTLYATQRAYVSVKPKWSMELNRHDGSIVDVGFWMSQENQGNTPAVNMVNRSSAVFLIKSDGVSFSYEKAVDHSVPEIPVTIRPRSEITTETQKFSINHMHKIKDGTAELFLSSWIEYNDVFEGTPKHGVEWCFILSLEGNLRPGECQARFDIHGQHNRYYECPPEVTRSGSPART
jgi:hypothetical protein